MSDFADAAGVLASLSSFSRMLFSFEMMRREVIVLGVAIAGRGWEEEMCARFR
jgi:hypothetical protein